MPLPIPCHKEDIKAHTCPHQKVFATGETISVTHTHIMPDGVKRVFEITASPVEDKDGNITGMIEILRDVTEKIRIEERLKEQKAFLKTILDSMDEALIVIGRDFKIISVNKVFLEQRKNTLNDITGRYCYEISHHYDMPCYEKGEECPVKKSFETGEHSKVIHTHYDKKGNPSYVSINSHPVRDSQDNIISAIECITDITEKVKLENEMKKRVKDLEEFYDMTVGRELKMIELKKEIERLKEELEKRR